MRKRISTPIRSQEKWLSDLQVENASDIDWKDANTIAFHCTASTKLRTFHYKFLHRRNDVKQFLILKGLKSTALTDLHLTGLSQFAPSTAIDLVILIGRHIHPSKLTGTSPSMTLFKGKLNSVIEMEK